MQIMCIPSWLIGYVTNEKSFPLELYDVAFFQFLQILISQHWHINLWIYKNIYKIAMHKPGILVYFVFTALRNLPLYFVQ